MSLERLLAEKSDMEKKLMAKLRSKFQLQQFYGAVTAKGTACASGI